MDPRLQLKSDIITCTRCDLRKQHKGPVAFEGSLDSGLAVIQKAPSLEATAEQAQLSKREREKFDEVMESTFPNPFIFSLVSCTSVGMNGKQRSPSAESMGVCGKHFADQMTLANPKFILLLDDVVLNRFRPDYFWSPTKGRPFFLQGDRLTICADHPINFTGGVSPDAFEESVNYLHYLSTLDGQERLDAFPDYCPCGRRGKPMAPDGLVKCDRCSSEFEEEMQVL